MGFSAYVAPVREILEPGEYTATLVGVGTKSDPSQYKPGEYYEYLLWTFEVDSKDDGYTQNYWERCDLAFSPKTEKLVGRLAPDIHPADRINIEPRDLIGRRYSLVIEHEKSRAGKVFAKAAYIKYLPPKHPARQVGAPAGSAFEEAHPRPKQASSEDFDDPFAND